MIAVIDGQDVQDANMSRKVVQNEQISNKSEWTDCRYVEENNKRHS